MISFTDNIYLDILIIGIAIIVLYLINKLSSSLIKRANKLSDKRKLILSFALRLITVLILAFLFIEGLPFFEDLDPEFKAIITSSVSIAIAFASSGIFENLVSGITLILLNPFEIDDIVSIGDAYGAIRSIKLTKTIIETFDNVHIEISNSDVISSKIVKFSLKMEKIKDFLDFKKQIHEAEKEGFPPIVGNDLEISKELKLKTLFESTFKKKDNPKIHNFTFTMEFQYREFRNKIEMVNRLCQEYEENFGFKPRYHISGLGHHIIVNFRLITLDSNNFFNYQPEFAKRVYQIVQS